MDLGDADYIADSRRPRQDQADGRVARRQALFVGIARTSDVERYLGGVPHTTVNDIE